MTFDGGGWYWGIWLTGIGLAAVLCGIGLAGVVIRTLALEARLRAYADLPVLTVARHTRSATSRLPQTIAEATQLVPRMQRAVVDLQDARNSLERSAASAAAGARAVGNFFAARRKR